MEPLAQPREEADGFCHASAVVLGSDVSGLENKTSFEKLVEKDVGVDVEVSVFSTRLDVVERLLLGERRVYYPPRQQAGFVSLQIAQNLQRVGVEGIHGLRSSTVNELS